MKDLSLQYIKSLLIYDHNTGIFYRRKSIQSRSMSGQIAGTITRQSSGNKYIKISIDKKRYYAHRLAWFYFYGFWPNIIDHLNGNGLDNRIDNLRNVNVEVNAKNQKTRSDNTSGQIGVAKSKRGRWRAYINVDKKRISLGESPTIDGAISLRKAAEKKYGYHENHGRLLK